MNNLIVTLRIKEKLYKKKGRWKPTLKTMNE